MREKTGLAERARGSRRRGAPGGAPRDFPAAQEELVEGGRAGQLPGH